MTIPAWKMRLWRIAGARLFRYSPHIAHGFRRRILRSFGASIHNRAKVRRSVRIDCPWNLTMRELAIIGDHAIIRCSRPVCIGAHSVVSQLSVVTTRIRDPYCTAHGYIDESIMIEDNAWVAADSLVLPGAVISEGTVVGARGLIERGQRTTPWHICVGHPVRAIKSRAFYARQGGVS